MAVRAFPLWAWMDTAPPRITITWRRVVVPGISGIAMPYPAGHREGVRKRIVESARRLFNRNGFENVPVDAIMADAGRAEDFTATSFWADS